MFIWLTAAMLVCALALGAEENLVRNPGFELRDASNAPTHWRAYVAPQQGATARLDDDAHDGQWAAMLHNPMPYDREPFNNWSQNIDAPPTGMPLLLRGHIKTDEATEAMVWAQCWRRRPLQLLHTASTSDHERLRGTSDWREVRTTFKAPANTDFITIRCVLRGVGVAWFDDISLGRAPDDKKEETPEPLRFLDANDGAATPDAPSRALSGDAARVTLVAPETLGDAMDDNETARPAPSFDELEQNMQRLREVNLLLMDALERMELRNEELIDEVLTLREEVRQLQDRTREDDVQPETRQEDADAPAVPPIVPHGADWATISAETEP